MKAQQQQEYKRDPFAEMDEEYDQYQYSSSKEYREEEMRRAARAAQRPYSRKQQGRSPAFYLLSYGAVCMLAMTIHTVMRAAVPDNPVRGWDPYYNGVEETYWVEGNLERDPDPLVTLAGDDFVLPVTVGQLAEAGWDVDIRDYGDHEIVDWAYLDEYYTVYLTKGDAVITGSVSSYTTSNERVSTDELLIDSLILDERSGGAEVFGVHVGMGTEEVEKVLTETTDWFYVERDAYCVYGDIEYTDHEDDSYSAYIYYENGEITSIDMNLYLEYDWND